MLIAPNAHGGRLVDAAHMRPAAHVLHKASLAADDESARRGFPLRSAADPEWRKVD